MAEAAQKIHLSYAAYLELEQETGLRHEHLNGEAWAMAGGSGPHSDIKVNLTLALGAALRGRPCRIRDSDFKITVSETGLTTYPDLSVFCGPVIPPPEDPHAGTNPVLLAEVLSPSTERWDRGGKFAHVRRLASLRYYLLVNVEPRRVELFTRDAEGGWRLTEHGPGAVVPLPELGLSLDVDALYENVEDEAVA